MPKYTKGEPTSVTAVPIYMKNFSPLVIDTTFVDSIHYVVSISNKDIIRFVDKKLSPISPFVKDSYYLK